MTVDEFLSITETKDDDGQNVSWDGDHDFLIIAIQNLINKGKIKDINLYFKTLLETYLSSEVIAIIDQCTADIPTTFKEDFIKASEELEAALPNNPNCKAIYFDVLHQGADAEDINFGRFFLCNQTPEEAEDWASDFDELVGEISVHKYFNYYETLENKDIDLDSTQDSIVSFYIMTLLFEICADVYLANNNIKQPLGFANDDWNKILIISK